MEGTQHDDADATATTKRPRRPRTSNDTIDENSLFLGLEKLVNKISGAQSLRFKKLYHKSSRRQGPDLQGLIDNREALGVLLDHAPQGLPNFVQVQSVLKRLDDTHDVFKKDADRSAAVRDHADTFKLMATHTRVLADSERVVTNPVLLELINKIKILSPRSAIPSPSTEPPQKVTSTPAQTRKFKTDLFGFPQIDANSDDELGNDTVVNISSDESDENADGETKHDELENGDGETKHDELEDGVRLKFTRRGEQKAKALLNRAMRVRPATAAAEPTMRQQSQQSARPETKARFYCDKRGSMYLVKYPTEPSDDVAKTEQVKWSKWGGKDKARKQAQKLVDRWNARNA